MVQAEDRTLDGRKTRNIYSWTPPNILTELAMGAGVNSTIVRRFYEQGIDLDMEAEGVTAKSVFSRAPVTE